MNLQDLSGVAITFESWQCNDCMARNCFSSSAWYWRNNP